MVFGGEYSGPTVVICVFILVVHGQDRHAGDLGIGWKKCSNVHHGPEGDIPQIGRRASVSDHAVRQHGERMRIVAEKHPRTLQPDAPATVGMIHKHQLAAITMCLFDSRKLASLGPIRLFSKNASTQGKNEIQKGA